MTTVAIAAALTVGGCSTASDDHAEQPSCTSTFDLGNNPEVLGSNARLTSELQDVKKRNGPFTMVDLTRSAGWSDDWDRMVNIPTNTKAVDLNTKAGTASCWKNLPDTDGEGFKPPQFYLFVKDGRPVQTVRWPKAANVIQFGDHTVLTKDSVLTVDANGWIVPR